jgi:hypothetical protein
MASDAFLEPGQCSKVYLSVPVWIALRGSRLMSLPRQCVGDMEPRRNVELDYRRGIGRERTRFPTPGSGAVGFLSLSTFFK